MDVIRSWVLSMVLFAILYFLIDLVITSPARYIYLLCPLLGAIAASVFHAEYGRGGWIRHLTAVIPVPALLTSALVILSRGLPENSMTLGPYGYALGAGAVTAVVGLGVVMLIRLLMTTRESADV